MINPCDIPIVEAALAYAQNGWPVFPLKGKIPFKDSSGLKDATTDPEQIQAWWTQHPTANIGLATGERSGIIVLDIDPPEGYFSMKALQATHSPLPDTRRSRTANKGLHYFFVYPKDGNRYRNAVGREPYTSKEAIASVRSAYSRPPRPPARRIQP